MIPTPSFPRAAVCLVVVGLCSCASQPEPSAREPRPAVQPKPAPPAAGKAEVETLEFSIVIDAPVEEVWDTMLGAEGYPLWTKPFLTGSYFEGTWGEGERMRFLGPGKNGMVAVIAAYRPHEVVSIEHVGFVMGGVEDTTSAGVRSWAPAYETYRFASVPGGTEVTVEQDALADAVPTMNTTWPEALAALEALCEAD